MVWTTCESFIFSNFPDFTILYYECEEVSQIICYSCGTNEKKQNYLAYFETLLEFVGEIYEKRAVQDNIYDSDKLCLGDSCRKPPAQKQKTDCEARKQILFHLL